MKIEANDLKQTLLDATEILRARLCKFHLTGGLASSFYGEPRFTQDIDIVIRIEIGDSLNQLIEDLKKLFVIDAAAIEDAVRRKSIFQALHEGTMIKIDFHVGEAIKGELERSRSEEILTGLVVPIVSKEDAILSKLIWIRKGSDKSRHDVKGMLKRSGKIDLDYLSNKALELGVENLLNAIKNELDTDQIS